MRNPFSAIVLILLTGPAHAEQPTMTCIEQEVVRERAEDQPAVKGLQRICFTDEQISNEIRFGDKRSLALIDLDAGRIALIPGAKPEYVELPLSDYLRLVAMRLEGTGLNDPEVQPRLVTTDEQKRIGDWQCRKLQFEQDGRMKIRAELWIAKDTPLDFAAWAALMDRLGVLDALGRIGKVADGIQGLPIEVRTEQIMTDQKLVTTTRVTRISTEPVGADTFRVPANLERVEAGPIPGLPGPGPSGQSDPPPAGQGG